MPKTERTPEAKMKADNLNRIARFLSRLKRDFRKWYATISVNELVSNRDLVLEIEVFERMLAKQGV